MENLLCDSKVSLASLQKNSGETGKARVMSLLCSERLSYGELLVHLWPACEGHQESISLLNNMVL